MRRARLAPIVVELDAVRRALHFGGNHVSRRNDKSESPDINYDTDYLRGVAELLALARRCRRRLGDVTAPALVLQAEDDPIVAARSGAMICERFGVGAKELAELPMDRHIVVRGEGEGAVGDHVVGFVEGIARSFASVPNATGVE